MNFDEEWERIVAKFAKMEGKFRTTLKNKNQ